jgi:hypothetical protein
MTGVYCLIGRCYDMMDNRARCLRALKCAIRIDPACIEAAEILCSSGFLSLQEKFELWSSLEFTENRASLKSYYK